MLTIARAPWPPTREPVTLVAGRLPLRSWRSFLRVVVWTRRLRRELTNTSGVVGYQVAYDVRAAALWTVSAWSTRSELIQFERSQIHCTAMTDLRPLLRPSTFAVWRTDAGLPPDWDEIRSRIRAVENG